MAPAPSEQTRVRRTPQRAVYDRAAIDAILDEALVAHVGYVEDDQPYVIPTLHARVGDVLYLHGSAASRTVRKLGAGVPACVTVSLLDGLVLARSVYHHSLNYRSVVVLGTARLVADPDERLAALHAFTERLVPGRWDEARPPSQQELRATNVLAISLDEASAKVRTGPPGDDPDDLARGGWAGVVPLALRAGAPEPDDVAAREGLSPSPAVAAWVAARA